MRKTARLTTLMVITSLGTLQLATSAMAVTPSTPDQARLEDLQHQADALNQELAQLKAAGDPASQQQYMQRHWSMMQDHMRSIRAMPAMGAYGCTDWMMMDPSVMGSGTMGHGMMGPGMMGPATCGDDMWGHGMQPGGMWGMPSHMTPGLYQSQMQGPMQRMRSQMAAIAAQTDPAKRDALLREHYQSMYRDMQTMRGMGWMWTPNAAASLPDPDSEGARLVARICSQCHSPPAPSLHTATEWSSVTARMRQHMQEQNNAAGSGVHLPSAMELGEVTRYMAAHALSQ